MSTADSEGIPSQALASSQLNQGGASSVEADSASPAGGRGRGVEEDDKTAQTSETVRASNSRINICLPGAVAPVPLHSSSASSTSHPRRRKKQYVVERL